MLSTSQNKTAADGNVTGRGVFPLPIPDLENAFDVVREYIAFNAKPCFVVVMYPGAANERAVAAFPNYLQACRLAVVFQNEGLHADVMRVNPHGQLTTEF